MCLRKCLFPYLHIMKNCNGIFCLTFLLSLFFIQTAFAQQSRKDLESQRKKLEQQIASTTEILKKTQKDKTISLQQVKTLTAQIRQRQSLLNAIQNELAQVDKETVVQETQKKQAEKEIELWQDRLSLALRSAYVRSQLHPDWIYILNAQSLGMVVARWVYLKQYKLYVKRQWEILENKQRKHQQLISELEENRKAKKELFANEEKNKQVILQEQKEKEALLKTLSKEEKKLKANLEETQKKKKKLDDEIARLISSETKKMTNTGLADAPATKALNAQFASNQGKLPWPVSKGVITEKFGDHPHPVLKGIQVQSNGINIRGEAGAQVKCLFDGEVASVTPIPGYDIMVMVRHGAYYTVYSNIQSASVKKGDKVKTGQMLGTLSSDDPELHLEIWKDKTKLNPEKWISSR